MHVYSICLLSCWCHVVIGNPLQHEVTTRACIPRSVGEAYRNTPLASGYTWCAEPRSNDEGASLALPLSTGELCSGGSDTGNSAVTPSGKFSSRSSSSTSGSSPEGTSDRNFTGTSSGQPSGVSSAGSSSSTDDKAESSNSITLSGGSGKKMQATVTGYGVCLTQGMACGLTGSPGKDPTAAMSAYLIPNYGKGNCGTCWRVTNARQLNFHGSGQVPTIGGPQASTKDGMVVMINNSCAPGQDQYRPGAVGQCTQTTSKPQDGLGSATVLDLCKDTDAVQQFFGNPNPGMSVADVEEVDCSEWSGTKRKAT